MKISSPQKIMIVVVGIITASCNLNEKDRPVRMENDKTAQPSSAQPPSSASAELDNAKTQVTEAVQATQDYTYAQKDAFVADSKKRMAEIQSELNDLSAQIDRSGGMAKAEAKAKLKAVNEKWIQAKRQLDKAENATASNWDTVKDGAHQSYEELKDAFDSTRHWLSDKIEP